MKALVVCSLFFGFALACGGDSTGPKAGSITGIFGDNDSVATGGTLSVGFTVLNGAGFPLTGAKVTWTVTPAAAATVTPPTQTSDSIGNISAHVTAGSAVGAFKVSASVNGVAPIDFHLKTVDPCNYPVVFHLGDTVNGALARTDCRLVFQTANGPRPWYYDFYRLDLPSGQQSIRINEASSGASKIDPYVELYRATADLVGLDDDIVNGIDQTAQLDIILGSGGSFQIGATSYDPDTIGPYRLTANSRLASLAGCQDAWMTPGATITDTIRASDCADSTSHYFDRVYMWMQPSEVIRVAERSTVVNPLLKLYVANFQTGRFDSVAANDDSATGNRNSYIAYTVPAEGWYLLLIGTTAARDSGEYTLAFSSSIGPTGRRSPSEPRVLPVFPAKTFRRWKKHS